MSTLPKPFLTPEQYLAIERKAEYKSEYYAGEMFAMAGAGRRHNQLTWNLATSLGPQIRGRPCVAFMSDMRVRVSATGLYTYPDLVVVCGQQQFADDRQDTLLNPTLIGEVLSPFTAEYDRGRKFEHYGALPSLRQYLLLSQDKVRVELFTRQPDGLWAVKQYSRLEEVMELESIGCRIALAELYEKLEFPPEGAD